MMKIFSVAFIFVILASFAFAQNEFSTVLNKADNDYNKKNFCSALDNYEKAMQIKELANYPMYHAAQSACQCHKPEAALKYAVESFKYYQDFYNYEYFAVTDTLNACFNETPEWKKILAKMKPDYDIYKARQDAFRESVNNQNLRLNYSADREKSLADSLQKLSGNKLAKYLQIFEDHQTPPKIDHWTLYHINIKDFGEVPFLIYIPKDYRPSEAKPLFVYMHGGVRYIEQFDVDSSPFEDEDSVLRKLAGLNTFIIYPYARKDFNWLFQRQAFDAITREVAFAKTLYNIDDNKVYIGGHSNGATGAFWFALNNRTDFAGFFGFSISPVLNLGQSFYANLNNEQQLITLNGTKDSTFKYESVVAVYEKAKQQYPNWILQPIKDGTHNFMRSSPQMVEELFSTLLKESRNPFPHSIIEQTNDENADPNFWLQVGQLNSSTKESKQSAVIKAEYANNNFTIESKGASEIKLLIPYGMVNYKKPVLAKVNGKLLFNKKITIEKAKMTKNFLKARDRKFLITNEIKLMIGD